MFKKLMLYTFLLLNTLFAYSNNKIFVTSFSDFDLLNKIDTSISKINIYRINSSNDTTLANVIKYDNFGRLNTIISLSDGKKVERINNITFFENTDIVLNRKTTSYSTGKPSVSMISYDYDSLFRISFSYDFNEDTSKVTTQQFFYNNKNCYKINYKSENSTEFFTKYIQFHDAQNRLLKRDCYGRDKKLLYTETEEYTYNISKEYLINKETKTLKKINEYKDNKLVKRTTPSNNFTIEGMENSVTAYTKEKVQVLRYDSNGNLVEIDDYADDKLIHKIILIYIKK